MGQGNVVSWSALMTGYLHIGFSLEVIRLLKDMVLGDAISPNEYVFAIALAFCSDSGRVEEGEQCHCYVLKSGLVFHQYVRNALLHSKFFSFQEVMWIWNLVRGNDIFAYNSVLSGVLENGYLKEGLEVLRRMVSYRFTFAVILNASTGLSAIRYGHLLHACIEKSGFKDYVTVGNALINMYAKGGDIQAATKVFSDMMLRDTITWNAMICGYLHHGLGKEALHVFQEMLAAQEYPNYVTFIGVLSACSHLGLVQEGFYYLNLMKESSIVPGLEHYACIVGLLGKAGRLDDA
ncbi:hypothetical protein GH714_034741 [Hevea brasiliensis]|uniref:Pentatricopeptide repeat-containing protein n=1 Tax=Hevea brasiliensis TaxID=3981 RepID=A0A6A6KPF4_HEVBR|nr:hypothetical protein GH714_034741 [Hevea brasiliensis]